MAKTVSPELQAHLAQDCTTLATCWQICLTNGTKLYLTDLDQNLTVDNIVYNRTPGFSKTAMQTKPDLSVDNMEIDGVLDSELITVEDLRAGLYDFATVYMFVVNYMDLSQGILKLRKGTLGEVLCLPSGAFTVELRGMVQRLQQTVGQVYSVDCRAVLGDARCKMPILPAAVARSTAYCDITNAPNGQYADNVLAVVEPQFSDFRQYGNVQYVCLTAGTTSADPVEYPTDFDATVVDGTATFQCVASWTRSAVVTQVTDQATIAVTFDKPDGRAVDGWYNYGVLKWESGNNNGSFIEVKSWSSLTGVIGLYLPMVNQIAVGDRLRVSVGCDNHVATCYNKFANINNFRGEPTVPGQDALTTYPDAH